MVLSVVCGNRLHRGSSARWEFLLEIFSTLGFESGGEPRGECFADRAESGRFSHDLGLAIISDNLPENDLTLRSTRLILRDRSNRYACERESNCKNFCSHFASSQAHLLVTHPAASGRRTGTDTTLRLPQKRSIGSGAYRKTPGMMPGAALVSCIERSSHSPVTTVAVFVNRKQCHGAPMTTGAMAAHDDCHDCSLVSASVRYCDRSHCGSDNSEITSNPRAVKFKRKIPASNVPGSY